MRPVRAPSSTWASTVEFEETLLEGEPCVFDHASAIGKWGPIFLELMQLRELSPGLEPRVYTGGAGGSNVAHIGYIVDNPAAESERLAAAGMPKFLHSQPAPRSGTGASR